MDDFNSIDLSVPPIGYICKTHLAADFHHLRRKFAVFSKPASRLHAVLGTRLSAAEIHRFVLSDEKPGVLRIPSGFAHGSMTLKADTRLIFFSTSTVAESLEDDYRYPFDYWNPWNVLPR